jgi:GNAT superfamily N-acetyltransferase
VTVTFIPLNRGDLERVVEMMARLYGGDSYFSAACARDATAKLLGEPDIGGVWFIVVDGEIAGYMVLVLGYSLEFGGRYGLLDELFLEEAYRGRGIGKQAIAFAAQECRARGWSVMRLEVARANEPARALYTGAGFASDGRDLMTWRM